MKHEWDPDIVWGAPAAPCLIYGDEALMIMAQVDQEDYQWAVQWRWSPKWSRGSRKVYLRRNQQIGTKANRIQRTLFLHHAIAERAGIVPASPEHVLLDHADGDGLNCRRHNLRWATRSQNARNRFGCHKHMLIT